jgi:hypothetical protein
MITVAHLHAPHLGQRCDLDSRALAGARAARTDSFWSWQRHQQRILSGLGGWKRWATRMPTAGAASSWAGSGPEKTARTVQDFYTVTISGLSSSSSYFVLNQHIHPPPFRPFPKPRFLPEIRVPLGMAPSEVTRSLPLFAVNCSLSLFAVNCSLCRNASRRASFNSLQHDSLFH